MAESYNYSFNGNLPIVQSSNGTTTGASFGGSLTATYNDSPGNIFGYTLGNVSVNGDRFIGSDLRQVTNQNGVVTYTVTLQPAAEPNTSAYNRFLYLTYNGRQPTSFVNARYEYSSTDFSVFPEARVTNIYQSQNVAVTAVPVCFVTGTKIKINRGAVAVEDLKVGDLAITASGALRPIIWIGHREISAEGGSLSLNQQPVRVRVGAFGHDLPTRDLFLSPGHPVLVGADAGNEGGVLVPVMCLINGTTISREPVTRVTYWHVELDAHDILLAEGLPAESYIDGGDRPFFSEASGHALHNPDFVVPGWGSRCRPVAVDGPLVEAERLRLGAVFAISLDAQCGWDSGEVAFAA